VYLSFRCYKQCVCGVVSLSGFCCLCGKVFLCFQRERVVGGGKTLSLGGSWTGGRVVFFSFVVLGKWGTVTLLVGLSFGIRDVGVCFVLLCIGENIARVKARTRVHVTVKNEEIGKKKAKNNKNNGERGKRGRGRFGKNGKGEGEERGQSKEWQGEQGGRCKRGRRQGDRGPPRGKKKKKEKKAWERAPKGGKLGELKQGKKKKTVGKGGTGAKKTGGSMSSREEREARKPNTGGGGVKTRSHRFAKKMAGAKKRG